MAGQGGRPRVAIVGAPNVGKSTLFNRLVGRRRALVGDHPGLTRDLIESPAALGDCPVILVDTGGLMPAGAGALAGTIRANVLAAAAACDLILFVVDARRGPSGIEEDLAQRLRRTGVPLILVVNKVDSPDLGPQKAAEFTSLGLEPILPVSAEHGLGMGDLHLEASRHLEGAPASVESREIVEVAIVGRPNVGKSSLLNALLESDRALVSDQPGTTRDSVDAELIWNGRIYRLVDTAGMRRPGRVDQGPEALSVGAARRALESADISLVMLDAHEGLVAQDLSLLGLVAGGRGARVMPAVVLANKIDTLTSPGAIDALIRKVHERLRFARFVPILPISARRGTHLDRILPAVEQVRSDTARILPTRELNAWLHRATKAHPAPLRGGKPMSIVFVTQSGTRPPSFTFLTNRGAHPHFSYVRYLENSLREHFAMHATPIVLRFRPRS